MIINEFEDSRRHIRHYAEEVIKKHGENNSVGKFDKFIRKMMSNWEGTGHDEDFYMEVIDKAYVKEFGS